METFRYIMKKLIISLITLWVLVTITFFLMHMLPGDPFLGEKAISEATKEALYAKYGLDKPLVIQYLTYLGNALRGDFGESLVYSGQPVMKILMSAFPYSFELGLYSLLFAGLAGIISGIFSALHNGDKKDAIAMFIAAIGISVPSFILGSLLQYYLAIKLSNWSAVHFGYQLFAVEGWENAAQKIIPVFVLGFGELAVISRMTKASFLDVIGQDYIKTAKACGLSKFQIIKNHMLRNGIMPVITVLGPMAASILTGAFVVENIFNIPGLGKHFINSIQAQDYTMIAGTTILYGSFLIAANLLVDIAYIFIDPGIKLGKKNA